MVDSDNGKVTLAEIKKDIAHLRLSLDEYHRETCKRLDRVESEADKAAIDITRLQERQGWVTGLQGLSAAIGAVLGRIGQT